MRSRLGLMGMACALGVLASGTALAQPGPAPAAPGAPPVAAPPPPPPEGQAYGAQGYAPPPAPAPAEDSSAVEDDRPFASSVGLKVLLGGSLWTTPDNIPGGYEGLGFAGSGGGFAYGGALYVEGRFFKYLGLEVDLGYDDTTLRRQVTYNGTIDVDESVESSGIWFGFLVKGVVPTRFGRFWVGLGPQFINPSSVDAKLDAEIALQDGLIKGKSESSTMLNMGLGLVIHAGDTVEIPVELRAAKNLSQEADWDKRVKLETNAANQVTGYEVTAQSSWDFRLGFGIGARF